MRIAYLAILLVIVMFGCKTTENTKFVGSWELIEFRLVGQGGDPVSDEETLKGAGAVWEMHFEKDGDFTQQFNMRKHDMTMETEEGTWEVVEDTLKIDLDIDMVVSELDYTYTMKDNLMVLTLAPEEAKAKIITTFRKK